ncbi:MAG: hypothetical protein R3F49_14440 [Planctomycetota bacterium]
MTSLGARARALFLASGALTSAALALPQLGKQVMPNEGLGAFSKWSLGFDAKYVGGSSVPNDLLIHRLGSSLPHNVGWSSAYFGPIGTAFPDFSKPALTSHWAGGTTPVEFSGMSTGGEITPNLSDTGVMNMTAPARWYFNSVVVDRFAVGEPQSLLNALTNGGTSSAADTVISYYADGSAVLVEELVDSVRVEYSGAQLNVALPPGSTAAEIDSLDWGIGVIAHDPGGRAGAMFPVRERFYFSLTAAWLAAYKLQHSGTAFTVQDPATSGTYEANAASVYAMEWTNASGPLAWSAPVVVFKREELVPSLTQHPLFESLELDAISVDEGSLGSQFGQAERLIFSLTPASDAVTQDGFNQLLAFQRPASSNNFIACDSRPLSVAGPAGSAAVPVTAKMGLRRRTPLVTPDNVKGTCGGDPIEFMWPGGVAAVPVASPIEPQLAASLSGFIAPGLACAGASDANDHLFLRSDSDGAPGYEYVVLKYSMRTDKISSQSLHMPQFGEWIDFPLVALPQGTRTHGFEFLLPKSRTHYQTEFRVEVWGVNLTGGVAYNKVSDSWSIGIDL